MSWVGNSTRIQKILNLFSAILKKKEFLLSTESRYQFPERINQSHFRYALLAYFLPVKCTFVRVHGEEFELGS